MIHRNPFISAFIGLPEFSWKNPLRHWLAVSPWVPNFIQNFSPIKGYETFRKLQPDDVVIDADAFSPIPVWPATTWSTAKPPPPGWNDNCPPPA